VYFCSLAWGEGRGWIQGMGHKNFEGVRFFLRPLPGHTKAREGEQGSECIALWFSTLVCDLIPKSDPAYSDRKRSKDTEHVLFSPVFIREPSSYVPCDMRKVECR
jgi:hypothetical protein